jgi:aldehyde dehydrogenase
VVLNKIADRIEQHAERIAVAESWDNGKLVRETIGADIPLMVDHFRYFAGAIRAQEGSLSQIDEDTVAYRYHEPLGVVGQIIPWNFPLLMATWKLAPALAAGNAVVLKPAEQTPASIMLLMDIIGDLLPPGVLNVVNGFGVEAGKPLASSNRVRKIAFTGETTTGRLIMQYARRTSSRPPSSSAASRRTCSSPTSPPSETPSTTRPWRASRCSRSTRARFARAHRGR